MQHKDEQGEWKCALPLLVPLVPLLVLPPLVLLPAAPAALPAVMAAKKKARHTSGYRYSHSTRDGSGGRAGGGRVRLHGRKTSASIRQAVAKGAMV